MVESNKEQQKYPEAENHASNNQFLSPRYDQYIEERKQKIGDGLSDLGSASEDLNSGLATSYYANEGEKNRYGQD